MFHFLFLFYSFILIILGPVVGKFCIDLAIKKAKEAGIGWVSAKGICSELLNGKIALIFKNVIKNSYLLIIHKYLVCIFIIFHVHDTFGEQSSFMSKDQ